MRNYLTNYMPLMVATNLTRECTRDCCCTNFVINNTWTNPCAQTSCRTSTLQEISAKGEVKGGMKRGLLGLRRQRRMGWRWGKGVPVHWIHVKTPKGVCKKDKEGMNMIRGNIVC